MSFANSLVCRACLLAPANEEFISLNVIYDEEEQLTYYDCFMVCTQIDLEEKNGLPYGLCQNCGLELQIAYDFQKKVMKASRTLLEKTDEIIAFDKYEVQDVELSQAEEDIIIESADETVVFKNIEELVAWEEDTVAELETTCESTDIKNEPEEAIVIYEEKIDQDQPNETKQNSSNESQTDNKCNICDKVFSAVRYLQRHRKIHEKVRETFDCSHCDRTYTTKNALKVHTRLHDGEGYICPICYKLFPLKLEVEVHMRFHTREFPYICDVCGVTFAQKSHLTTHMSVKHQGLRLSCNQCGRLFQNSSSLRQHSFVHTEMPFHCAYCEKRYPSKHKLKVHIRTKHGMEIDNEELNTMLKFKTQRKKHTWVKIDEEVKDTSI